MSAPCTEPAEPAAIRHEIGGTVVETVRRTDGWWLYRCPEIVSVNARYWRGHFESQQAARTQASHAVEPSNVEPKRERLNSVVNPAPLPGPHVRGTGGTQAAEFRSRNANSSRSGSRTPPADSGNAERSYAVNSAKPEKSATQPARVARASSSASSASARVARPVAARVIKVSAIGTKCQGRMRASAAPSIQVSGG